MKYKIEIEYRPFTNKYCAYIYKKTPEGYESEYFLLAYAETPEEAEKQLVEAVKKNPVIEAPITKEIEI